MQPIWPAAKAPAGTITNDGTVVWTVVDPNGIAFRLDRLATYGSEVWQMKPAYQRKPPNITNLSQTFYPIPDDLSYLIKQGFIPTAIQQMIVPSSRSNLHSGSGHSDSNDGQ